MPRKPFVLTAAFALALALPAGAFDAAAMREDASLGTFASDLGADVLAADLDADALPELIIVNRRTWFVLEHEPPVSWRMRWYRETDDTSNEFLKAAIADLDADGVRELIIVRQSSLDRIDPRTGARLGSTPIATLNATFVAFGDVEPPAGDEILVPQSGGLQVTRLDGTVLWTVPGVGYGPIAVGQVDLDATPEIVVDGDWSYPSAVVDCVSRSIQWTIPASLGYVVTADLDGDGVEEILTSGSSTSAWDAVAQSQRWTTAETSAHLRPVDMDGDGDLDVAAHWLAFDGATGAVIAQVGASEPFDVVDADGDCRLDVVTASDPYPVAGVGVRPLAAPDFSWFAPASDQPPTGFAFADVDGDGVVELAQAHASESGVLLVGSFDVHARRQARAPVALTSGYDPYAPLDVEMLQLDADPALEILHASWIPTAVNASDAMTGELQWSATIASAERITSLVATAGPGGLAVGVGLSAMNTSSIGTQVRILDASGAETWRSRPMGTRNTVRDVHLADLDGDGAMDVAAVLEGVGPRVLHPPQDVPSWAPADDTATSLDVADLDGDGALEILVGTSAGRIAIFDAATQAPLATLSPFTDGIHALRVLDVDGDGEAEIAATHGDGRPDRYANSRLAILSRAGASLWESAATWGRAGLGSGIVSGDVDRDGSAELAVATAGAVHLFEYRASAADGAPPAFLGAALAATASPCCPGVDLAWPAAEDDAHPPMTFEIHRSTDPAFTVSPATFVAARWHAGWRDATASVGAALTYAIVPVDGAGRRGAELRATVAAEAQPAAPAVPVNVVAADADACRRTGAVITFDHDGIPAGVTYDLVIDGSVARRGVTSPVLDGPWFPEGPRAYAIVAVHPTCGTRTESAASTVVDAYEPLSEPWIQAIDDLARCAATGLEITFSHLGFPTAGHYELVDEADAVLASPVTSPWIHVPPDDAYREYRIRAVSDACPQFVDSSPDGASDFRGEPDPPVITRIEDPAPCLAGPITFFVQRRGPPGTTLELRRDGVSLVADFRWPWQVTPDDALPHDYVIRLDDGCGGFADSAPVSWTDGQGCVPAEPELRVRRAGADAALEVTPMTGAATYDAYVGTLDSLWSSRAYDHAAAAAGVSFPSATDPATGCGSIVAPAVVTTLRDNAGRQRYVLVVARGLSGRSDFGHDSLGREIRAQDPRPDAAFCP